MKNIEVTLYDVFGYVFPGAVFVAALCLFYWTAFPKFQLDIASITGVGWTFLLMVAYVSGHVVQYLTNLLELRGEESAVDKAFKTGGKAFPAEVADAARAKACALIGSPETVVLAPQTVFKVCDHYVMQAGETATRDVFVYREGFYRGMSAALALLAIALGARVFAHETRIAIFGVTSQFTEPMLLVLALGSDLLGWAFYRRYRRFRRHHIDFAVYGALTIRDKKEGKQG